MRIIALLATALLSACGSTTKVRIENISAYDFENVSIADQPFGDVPAGAATDYRPVTLRARYASMKLWIDKRYTTAQALHFGGGQYTWRIAVKDQAKGHLDIEVVPDEN